MAGGELCADDTRLGFHAELDLTEGNRSTGEVNLSASTQAENVRFSEDCRVLTCRYGVEIRWMAVTLFTSGRP